MSIEPISRIRPTAWHLLLVFVVSAGFESLFLRHGLNRIDEGWPLYAAQRLLEGGTLYRDVFFVFPPGHLLGAWLGQVLDPPGLLVARGFYGAFNVAACLGIYLLGRRVMAPHWALLGALLLAVGAPDSHYKQLLFGYRYLALGMLALLAFGRRLDTGSRRWTLIAGLATGVALAFRPTPAFATAVAIGIGLLVSERRPRVWLQDGLAFTAGLAIPVLPLIVVLGLHAGFDGLIRELVVRPAVMTEQQSLPIPGIAVPAEWTRRTLRNWFVGVQFRAYGALYAVYGLVLVAGWLSARRRREPFRPVFLTTLVAWGALYFVRTLGRSDEPHLDSALPPVCLMLAHAASQSRRVRWPRSESLQRWLQGAVGTALFVGFAFLSGSDFIAAEKQRGRVPIASAGGEIFARNAFLVGALDWCVEELRKRTSPDDTVLDLSASPLLLVLAERRGPGGPEIVMPGTFLDTEEERAFVARLERAPPALVIRSKLPFDRMPERGLDRTAPILDAWARDRYEVRGRRGNYTLWAPSGSLPLD